MADGFFNSSMDFALRPGERGRVQSSPFPSFDATGAVPGGETMLDRLPGAPPAPVIDRVGAKTPDITSAVPEAPVPATPATPNLPPAGLPGVGPTALDQVMSAPGTVPEATDFTQRDGLRGGTIQREDAAPPASSLVMPTLKPPDERFTGSLGYYEAMTNDGDLAGAVMVNPGRRVRLIDPGTGQVVAEGVGPEGAQQIVALANAVSRDLGRKAQWAIEGENDAGEFVRQAGERYDPKKPSLFKQIVRIAAPLLGAAIPGLAPALGAALGGFGGTLGTGGSLKESLLAGAAGGIGNVAGGALSSALRGAPVAWSGVNPLGGALGGGVPTASGLTPEALWQPVDFVNTPASLAGGAGGAAAAGAGAGGLAGTVAPVTVTGGLAGGGLSPALAAGLGTVAGSVPWYNAAPETAPAVDQQTFTDADWEAFKNFQIPPLGTPGASSVTSGSTPSQPTGGEVEGVTVTGQAPAAAAGGVGAPGLPSTGVTGSGGEQGSAGQEARPEKPLTGGGEVPDWLLDFVGQTVGGVGADLGVYGLAQLLGFLPGAGGGGQPRDSMTGDQGGGGGPGPVGPGGGPGPGTPGSGGGGGGGGPGTIQPPGQPGAGVPGTPAAATFSSSSTSTGGPGGAAPKLGTRGSTAPDIYPWRRPGGR